MAHPTIWKFADSLRKSDKRKRDGVSSHNHRAVSAFEASSATLLKVCGSVQSPETEGLKEISDLWYITS